MAALFACTKCHRRYPFEDLSHGEQLCKDCRSNFPVVKCTYCRAEFQLNSKGSTSTICSKCADNVKAYGKPTACEYCSILAAFIGKRCQRCVNSEKKWGPPLTCEQCKLKCAFNRHDESKRKVDGKNLCWLCTQAYKRVLAKTRKNQDFTLSMKKPSSSGQENWGDSLENRINLLTQSGSSDNKGGLAAAIMKLASSNTKFSSSTAGGSNADSQAFTAALATSSSSTSAEKSASNGHHYHKHIKPKSLSEQTSSLLDRTTDLGDKGGEGSEGQDGKHHRSHHRSKSHHHHHHHRSKHHHNQHHQKQNKPEEADESSTPKKQKLDKSVSNGASTPKSTGSNVSDTGVLDTNNSDNVILITQLREQIESLKKQLTVKDAQLLEKDKKITELKAENYEADKESRQKVLNVQRMHEETISNLQVKNRELQRQVTKLSKGVKKSVLESINNSS